MVGTQAIMAGPDLDARLLPEVTWYRAMKDEDRVTLPSMSGKEATATGYPRLDARRERQGDRVPVSPCLARKLPARVTQGSQAGQGHDRPR